MQRLYFLIERCYQLKEHVLLIGEIGGGKTMVCQLMSMALTAKLNILNYHQYTETSDFIGEFYPVRERSRIALEFKSLIDQLVLSETLIHFNIELSTDIGKAPSTLKKLMEILDSHKHGLVSLADNTSEHDLASTEKIKGELSHLSQQCQTIFVWQDGPLVQAMKNGDSILADEISLANDSVLEQLNSVLEPERKLMSSNQGIVVEQVFQQHACRITLQFWCCPGRPSVAQFICFTCLCCCAVLLFLSYKFDFC